MSVSMSLRLKKAFECLLPGQDVWDICCDHGYLGGAAYKSELFLDIYFVDPVIPIMDSLQHRFSQFVFNENNKSKAHFITDRAENITQPVSGTLCILGVGGVLIQSIISSLHDKNLLIADRLVLSPHRHTESFLKFMDQFEDKKMYQKKIVHQVIERGRVREIFVFDRQL